LKWPAQIEKEAAARYWSPYVAELHSPPVALPVVEIPAMYFRIQFRSWVEAALGAYFEMRGFPFLYEPLKELSQFMVKFPDSGFALLPDEGPIPVDPVLFEKAAERVRPWGDFWIVE
jgi:hypothetical protein